jgi:hypothetical protein
MSALPPKKRTFVERVGMSALRQKRTSGHPYSITSAAGANGGLDRAFSRS